MASDVLNQRLQMYLEAEHAILVGGQSYKIGNRTLTRADLGEIRDAISALQAAGATADDSSSGRRTLRCILHD